MKKFFSQLGCLLWLLLYLGVAVVVGVELFQWVKSFGWFSNTGFWLICLAVMAIIIAAIVFIIECGITFLIMIARDPDYDNPSPFPLRPLK